MRNALVLIAMVLAGCGPSVAKRPESVLFSGTVTRGGSPLSDAMLHLQPTGDGNQSSLRIMDGKFEQSVTPGKYTYFVTQGAAGDSDLPAEWTKASMERQLEINEGTKLDIKIP